MVLRLGNERRFGLSGCCLSYVGEGVERVNRGRLVWGRLLVAFSCAAALAGFVSAAVVSAAAAPRTLRLLSGGSANPDPNALVFFGGVSADGTRVFFTTTESLLPQDTDNALDVYSRDLDGSLRLLSDGSADPDPNAGTFFGGVSADGARVFFGARERLVEEDTDTATDVYSRDVGGSLRLLSDGPLNADPEDDADIVGVSADGAHVFFETTERLLPLEDTDRVDDVYSRDLDGSPLLLSDDVSADTDPEDSANFGGVSADGARVFFETTERLVPQEDTDTDWDVYSRELDGSLRLLSDGTADPDPPASAFFGGVSADGARVFFTAEERLLPDEDGDAAVDVYEREADGTLRLLSGGTATADPDPFTFFSGVSADGARVFFETDERLVAEDTDTALDVYSRDSDGSLRLLSDGSANPDPNAGAFFGGVSADGARVFFTAAESLAGGRHRHRLRCLFA